MTTDPGDLVFDPTCGSGTTAYVAEQWGRRWITCDTSRVALTLAKQRLMTAVFDYYELAHPSEGVGSGFKYKTVPHVTLKSIANNPDIREGMTREQIDAAIARHAPQETLYDQPFVDRKRTRVSGPFTVEAVPAPAVKSVDQVLTDGSPPVADASIARSGETFRQGEWRDELLRAGIRGKAGQQELRERLDGADTMSRGNEGAAFIAGCATGVVFVWVLVRLTVTVTPQDFRDLCDSLYDYAVSASDVLAIHREHPYCRIPEVTSTASHDLRSPRHADWRQSFEVRP